jgi:hypothetical protein
MGATVRAAESHLEQVAEISVTVGGIEVRGRCNAIGEGPRLRHEVLLEAGVERAVVDVPRGADPEAMLHRAVELFSESLAARR